MHLFALFFLLCFFLLYTISNVQALAPPWTESHKRKPRQAFFARPNYPKVADFRFPGLGNRTANGSGPPSATDKTAPTKVNIAAGRIVLINGFTMGMTALGIQTGIDLNLMQIDAYNPFKATFYNNAYRWLLRYLANVPDWLGGYYHMGGSHRVWRKRYMYAETFVPKWARYLIPWVKKDDWENEEKDMKLYRKFADSTFGRYRFYPHKIFSNFSSQIISSLTDSSSSSD